MGDKYCQARSDNPAISRRLPAGGYQVPAESLGAELKLEAEAGSWKLEAAAGSWEMQLPAALENKPKPDSPSPVPVFGPEADLTIRDN
jgi:hypothetical protein